MSNRLIETAEALVDEQYPRTSGSPAARAAMAVLLLRRAVEELADEARQLAAYDDERRFALSLAVEEAISKGRDRD